MSEQPTLNKKVFKQPGTTLGQGRVSMGLLAVVVVVPGTTTEEPLLVPGTTTTAVEVVGWITTDV